MFDHRPATTAHLHIVDPLPAPALGPVALEVSLSSAPFRPGELPIASWISLDELTRERIEEGATTARVPAELWLRLAVEAARLTDEIAAHSGRTRQSVQGVLDTAAAETSGDATNETLRTDALARYAALLRTRHPAGPISRLVPMRLPEEMSGGWRRAAIHAGVTFERWVAERVEAAPTGCVAWEIAAAECCQTLAEWAYAAFLRSLACTTA